MSGSVGESELESGECDHSQLVELKGSGLMEINNLAVTAVTDRYCASCDTPCQIRCPNCRSYSLSSRSTIKEVQTKSADSFYKKDSSTWKLSGEGCFHFQNQFIHLDMKLLPNNIDRKYCKLITELKSCPHGSSLDLKEIKEALVTVFFLDKGNDVVTKKCFRINELNESSNTALISMDEKVFTTDLLAKFCRSHPAGIERKSSYGPVSKKHQFISLHVQLQILLLPDEVKEFSNPSTCTSIIVQDQLSVKTFRPALPKVKTTSDLEVKDRNKKKEKLTLGDMFKSNKSVMTAVDDTALKFTSKFTDLVDIRCGSLLEHTLSIHKEVLMEKSPVFLAMLSTKMSEAETGEIKMPTVSPEVVQAFICFLYKTKDVDGIEGNVELMVGVLELAHTYQIPDLISDCTQRLVSRRNDDLNIKSALRLYSCGHLLNISDLQCRALQWFVENKQKITLAEEEAALAEFMQNENAAAISLFIQLKSGFRLDHSEPKD